MWLSNANNWKGVVPLHWQKFSCGRQVEYVKPLIHICFSLLLLQFLGDQEADQEDDPILNQGVGDDPKVQGGEGLIPEREVDGQGAHQKTGTRGCLLTEKRILELPRT